MYKYAIVDDNIFDKERMSKLVHDYFIDKNITIQEVYYQDPLNFDFELNYDFIFLDIDMPTENGINLAKKIKTKLKTKIIFMSNHSEYVFSSLDIQPFHFIKKESLNIQTFHVLNLLYDSLKKENLFIRDKNTLQKINYTDIYYISINDHICDIHTYDNNYQTWDTLSCLYKQLSSYDFIKINRSQIVNLKHIKQIDNFKLLLTNNTILNISIRLKSTVINEYEEYIMRSI